MSPKEVVHKWVKVFNQADAKAIAEFYHADAINHQVVNEPVVGKEAIHNMFKTEFIKFKTSNPLPKRHKTTTFVSH